MIELADRMREKAKKRGAPVATNPLRPGDRRIIHMALKKDADLTTWSKGSGALKKVIIAPRQSAQS
jgi:spoIIIJ-associated protein